MMLVGGRISSTRIVSKWKVGRNLLSTSASGEIHPNVIKSDSKDIVIPEITVPELLFDKIPRYSKFIATESAATGKTYTYDEVAVKSKNFSKHLRKTFNLQPGDVGAFFMQNIPEYILCFMGALDARLIITTMNHLYTADEISKQIIDANPKIVVTQAPQLETLKNALKVAKKDLPIIVIKETQEESIPQGTIDFFELINTKLDVPDLEPGKSSDVAIMPYSSGTTGLPKGVELTHKNMVANIKQMESDDFRRFEAPSESHQDLTPAVLPFYHIYGLMSNFMFLNHGVRCVALNKFVPEFYISVLKKYRPTTIYAAPPLVLFLSLHPEVKSEYFENLHTLSSGAAPLGYMDEERFLKKVGRPNVSIIQGYGLTEASPVISYTPNTNKRNPENGGSVGKLVPNTYMKIINPENPNGEPLGVGEKGEILIKGPQVMKGYYNRPEETENVFLDGWLRTGDIGYYNKNHHLWICDRLKELIKVKGFQVAPAELEEILRDHPSVNDAAVIGIPHPSSGEVPRAYIVPKQGTQLNLDELNEFVNKKVATYKKLAGGIEIVASIPKNPAGKILRRHIKEEYLKKIA